MQVNRGRKRRRYSIVILCILALLLAGYLFSTPPWLRRALVRYYYVQIADGVYADPTMTDAARRRVLADLQRARDRIAAMFGTTRARPVTIIASNNIEAGHYGLRNRVPGAVFVSAISTHVVLNMKDFSLDVTAHELMHAELADRLGYLARMTRLPIWLDEGIAVQLDWRRSYQVDCAEIGAQRIREVKALFNPSQFQSGNKNQIVANYQAAKCSASQALARQPMGYLYEGLRRIRDGEDVNAVFGNTD